MPGVSKKCLHRLPLALVVCTHAESGLIRQIVGYAASHTIGTTRLYNRKPALVREASAPADVQQNQARICAAAAARWAAAAAGSGADASAQAAAALLGQQEQRCIAEQGAVAQAQYPVGGSWVA